MKSPCVLPKVAALTSFALLVSSFVAYRAGVGQVPDINSSSVALAAEKDSAGERNSSDSPAPDSLQQKIHPISVASTVMPLPKLRLADSAVELRYQTITVTDDNIRWWRMDMMHSSKMAPIVREDTIFTHEKWTRFMSMFGTFEQEADTGRK